MKLIERSSVDALAVFDDCSAGMNRPRKTRLESVRSEVESVNRAFLAAADSGAAFSFPREVIPPSDELRSDMKYLYESKFRDERRSNSLFDSLILQAAGDCPYCGLDDPRTLDHCLPKSIYPHLSVSPLNLVPSCWACNLAKTDTIGASVNAYSDEWAAHVPWLVAEMEDLAMPSDLKFSARMPPGWSDEYGFALNNLLTANSLRERYSNRARTRWNTFKRRYRDTALRGGIRALADHFTDEADTHAEERLNSWEAAAYRCWATETPRIIW